MPNVSLADIARNVEIVAPSTVLPGDLVRAQLALPIPGDSLALGDGVYTIDVRWYVTTQQPAIPDPLTGFVNPLPAPAALGTDYIAPAGLTQQAALFGLMPPFGLGAAPLPPATPYWLIAEFTLRRAGSFDDDVLGLLTFSAAKASPQIDAAGISGPEFVTRLTGLFKVELPAAPLEAGAPITAKLRPRGGEDAQWDIESASEIAPQFELAAKVQLEPLFRPLSRIINGVFGIGNQVLGLGARAFTPLVRGVGFIGDGVKWIQDAVRRLALRGKSFRTKSPVTGLKSIERQLNRLLRRMRIRAPDIFKGLELPIDADLLNRNFTKNLVPRNAVPPLPGPGGLLPTVPSLEKHLEVMDSFPAGLPVVPVIGELAIPFAITNVAWEVWDGPDVNVANQLQAGINYFELEHTAGRLLKRTLAFIPPVAADATVYLRVLLTYDVGGVAQPQIELPMVPIRLLRFDPLAFVAQQLELTMPVEGVEPGEPLGLELLSGLPIDSTSLASFDVSIPLGVLPAFALPVNVAWQVLDQNRVQLAEGADYGITGTSSAARSILFVPALQIMRREDPQPTVRYVQVVLTTANPPLQAVIGPVPVPVLGLQVPVFVALFKQGMFQSREEDEVQVLLPDFYTTQAPEWVESWDTFRTRLDELRTIFAKFLSIAGGMVGGPTAPGSGQILGAAMIRQLTLLTGALDYVANRAQKGKLEFMPLIAGQYWAIASLFFGSPGISRQPFRSAHTIIVVNDAPTYIDFARPLYVWSQHQTDIIGTPALPLCAMWLRSGWVAGWTFIPRPPDWPSGESPSVSSLPPLEMRPIMVSVTFDQQLPINKYFPSPAEQWYVPPPEELVTPPSP